MRRLLLLTICALLFMGTSALMQCSTPLELDDDGPNPGPTRFIYDTTYITDTLFGSDTLIFTDTIVDTIYVGDTVFVIDTVIDTVYTGETTFVIDTIIDTIGPDTIIIIDTIYVDGPDSGGVIALCVTVYPKQHMIDWILLNSSGDYSFEWTATVHRDKPCQTLIVEIDGTEYEWDPYAQSSLDIDQYLGHDASVKVYPEHPNCYGHAIDICVTIMKK